MRSVSLGLALLVLAVVLGWLSLETIPQRSPAQSQRQNDSRAAVTSEAQPDQQQPAAVATVPPPNATLPPSAVTAQSPPGEQRAFRFVLNGDKIELEAVEDMRGDFHRRRGPMAWQPGMFYCRLLDAAQRVLAEDTLAAPDRTCVVLDPNTPDANGKPRPVVLTATGPAVFQVRLPKIDSATQMKIYRLAGTRPAMANEEPLGQLLATIPLSK